MKCSPRLPSLDSLAGGSAVPLHYLRKLIPFIGVVTFGVALYILHEWQHELAGAPKKDRSSPTTTLQNLQKTVLQVL